MSHLSRRSFIKSTLAAAATVTIAGTKSSGQVRGANEVIRVAVAGLNGRGGSHVGAFAGMKGVQVTHLVDPDTRTFGRRVKQVQDAGGNKAQTVQDIRRVLQDRNVDVITIATPNHWHSLMTIWACQAGKDVYVEKPLSHNVFEGRIAVEAARRHNRIVQHGTQSRSGNDWARTVEVIRSGKLGRLLVARGLCYKRRDNAQGMAASVNNINAPKELDFDLWTGPAAVRPYHENLVHYRWHWFWEFGNGDIGNQGVHEMDKARWGIPGATLPRSVISVGGRFGPADRAETPNTQIAIFDYGQTQLIFEVRGLSTPAYQGLQNGVGNTFHLEEGVIANNQFFPRGSTKPAPMPQVNGNGNGRGGNHFANFINAVRSRRQADLNADILEGHYSSALCHLANISYRLGEQAAFNPRTKAFGDNKDAYDALARMQEHLGKGNGLKLDGLQYRVGRRLNFDAKTERFVDNAQANALLTRPARKGFAVPERIN